MIPNIEFLGKTISAYMLTALIGVLLVLWFTYRTAQKNKLDEVEMLYMMLFAFVGVLVGGHMMYGITQIGAAIRLVTSGALFASRNDFFQGVGSIFGGSVYYGGLLGAIAVSLIYLKKKKLPLGAYTDVAALAIPLFHFFGRVGCFLSGCCYGAEVEWGFVYHYALIESANGVPRFPVQLVEALLNLALFLVLFYLYRRQKAQNRLLILYLLTYPIYRFILEFWRGDEYRGIFLGLSTSQIISILVFIAAFIALLWQHLHQGVVIQDKTE